MEGLYCGEAIVTGKRTSAAAYRAVPGRGQHRWRIDGTTFDRAIANGIDGSARILAALSDR